MSKQRQRDRAAREAAATAAAARAARPRKGSTRKGPDSKGPDSKVPDSKGPGSKGPQRNASPPAGGGKRPTVYRQRRFPPLPWRLKLALALGWLTAAALTLYLVPTWTGRVGFLVVATFALPLIVVLVHDPSRRTR